MSREVKYYNVPIELLKGFINDSIRCLDDVLYFATYEQSLKYEIDNDEEPLLKNYKTAMSWLGYNGGNTKKDFERGEELYNSLNIGYARVGINRELFWDYYKNKKTEFEKILFLAHLALKSIIGNKPYIKTNNQFWFSRMAGSTTTISTEELPLEISSWQTRRKTERIKNNLELDWGLVTCSTNQRGFWISYKLDIQQLLDIEFKSREAYKLKELKKKKSEARKAVRDRNNK